MNSGHGYSEGGDDSVKPFVIEHTVDHMLTYFAESAKVIENIVLDMGLMASIATAANIMVESLKKGGKIIAAGNGGSMCDAMHFCAELTGKYKEKRDPIAAICLSNMAAMTAIGNDYGFGQVFSREIVALGGNNDVALLLSTSGKSSNIMEAIAAAKIKGVKVILITGQMNYNIDKDHPILTMADVHIQIPSTNVAIVQQATMTVLHLLVELIEKSL